MALLIFACSRGGFPIPGYLTPLTGPAASNGLDVRARRQEQLQRLEATFNSLPIDVSIARAYGRIVGAVIAAKQKHSGARSLGLLIAATALANQPPLYTRNPDDFVGLVSNWKFMLATQNSDYEPLLQYNARMLYDQMICGSNWPLIPIDSYCEQVHDLPMPDSVRAKWMGAIRPRC